MLPKNYNDPFKFSVTDQITGEEIELHTGSEFELIDEPYEIGKQYNSLLRSNGAATLDVEVDGILNNNILYEILGIDVARIPDQYYISYLQPVQKRKNKKKRINKKWAKKYGYIAKAVMTKGWKIETHADGTFQFKR